MRIAGWIGCVLAAAVVAGGCSLSGSGGVVSKDAASRVDAARESIRIGLWALPEVWDPGLVFQTSDMDVASVLHASLVRSPSGRVRGWLASDVRSEDGGRAYVITLREGAAWSDGRPVTARDVVFTWRRNASKAFGSGYAYVMEPIVGFDEVNAGADPSKLGVAATGERTVRVELERVVPWFERMLWLPIFTPVPSHVATKPDWAKDPTRMVHSGGYDVARIDGKRVVELVARPGSWALHKPHARTITLRAFTRDQTAWSFYRSGKLDAANDIFFPNTDPEVGETSTVTHRPDFSNGYLVVASQGVLSDVRLRRLIYRTIDPKRVLAAYEASSSPAHGLIPPQVPGADIVNAGAARREELPAGSAHGALVRLAYQPEDGRYELEVKRQLETVGFKVKLVPFYDDGSKVISQLNSDPKIFDIAYNSWAWDYPDPHTYFGIFACDGMVSFGYCDPAFDGLLDRASATIDDDDRYALERRAMAKLMGPEGSFTVVPTNFGNMTFGCHKNVVCFSGERGRDADYYYDEMYVKG